MKKVVLITFGLCILGIGAVLGYNELATEPLPTYNSSALPNISSATGGEEAHTRIVPEGFKEYRNPFYKFSLVYPEALKVNERKGAGSTITITFENPNTKEAFQMYILPYGESHISKERFLLDTPSGIMASSSTAEIDGITAGTFYSQDTVAGATYEVWVINKGFLYEITTYAELDMQLNEILRTFIFL